jgi:Alpha-L-arabinofuranosidase B, catalytic
MRHGFLALLYILASSVVGIASATSLLPLLGAGAGNYVGPGDLVSGAKAWYGLRAYNNAYGTGSNNAITIRRTSDSTTSNIKILTNGALDTASATTFCNATTCFIQTFFDQSGALNCSSAACDATQPTAANQPQLIFNCINTTLPCARFVGASDQKLVTPGVTLIAQPFTISFSAKRTSTFTSYNAVFGSTISGVQGGYGPAANQAYIFGGTLPVQTATASDSAYHNVFGILNATSSSLVVDATTTGSLSPGTSGVVNSIAIGDSENSTNPFTGDFLETGVWPGALSGANMTSICHNQFVYWATSTSC